MDLLTIIFIALGLAMDAFAASLFCGLSTTKVKETAIKVAVMFGLFQGGMTALGWALGLSFRHIIAPVDHWIAFLLLSAIGLNYIKEAKNAEVSLPDVTHLKVLLTLSIATSIDALATGITFSVLEINIFTPAFLIGIITFCLSYFGVIIAKRLSNHLNLHGKVDIIGGLILIGMGVKILLEHLNII